MSRINPINRQDVPELEPFLSATEKRMGFVPNSQLVMAHKPRLLQAFSQLGQAVHDPANKTPRQLRMLVAHMASKSAGCQYCVAHTGESAHNANVEDQKIAAVVLESMERYARHGTRIVAPELCSMRSFQYRMVRRQALPERANSGSRG